MGRVLSLQRAPQHVAPRESRKTCTWRAQSGRQGPTGSPGSSSRRVDPSAPLPVLGRWWEGLQLWTSALFEGHEVTTREGPASLQAGPPQNEGLLPRHLHNKIKDATWSQDFSSSSSSGCSRATLGSRPGSPRRYRRSGILPHPRLSAGDPWGQESSDQTGPGREPGDQCGQQAAEDRGCSPRSE